jgi:hypothetical protein
MSCLTKTYRRQFPISATYVFTIHKSQGQTIDYVIGDIAPTPQFNITPFAVSRGAVAGTQFGCYVTLMTRFLRGTLLRTCGWKMRDCSIWRTTQRRLGMNHACHNVVWQYGFLSRTWQLYVIMRFHRPCEARWPVSSLSLINVFSLSSSNRKSSSSSDGVGPIARILSPPRKSLTL